MEAVTDQKDAATLNKTKSQTAKGINIIQKFLQLLLAVVTAIAAIDIIKLDDIWEKPETREKYIRKVRLMIAIATAITFGGMILNCAVNKFWPQLTWENICEAMAWCIYWLLMIIWGCIYALLKIIWLGISWASMKIVDQLKTNGLNTVLRRPQAASTNSEDIPH